MATLPAALLTPPLAHPSFPPLLTPTGLALPRGRITEIFDPPSSGRTSLALSALAQATTALQESCAYLDAHDTFDPVSAARAGVTLHRLLWVRAAGNLPHALKAADLLLQSGGFGLVTLDLGDADPHLLRRIPLNYWYRFRHAIERTRTILLLVAPEAAARQCAAVSVEARPARPRWSGTPGVSLLLDAVELSFQPRKPAGAAPLAFAAAARP